MIVAIKDEKGKVKLRQADSLLTSDDVVFAGFCGSLTSLIFLNATTGAASGALADVGKPAGCGGLSLSLPVGNDPAKT